MEKKMETTVMGYIGLGVRVDGLEGMERKMSWAI